MKIGFIGAGNMASAIINGLIDAKTAKCEDLLVFDKDEEKLKKLGARGINVMSDNNVLAAESDVVVFAIKPNVLPYVLDEITPNPDTLYISIAAGVTIAAIEEKLGADMKIVRAMPNTPAMVNCGTTVITPNTNITKEEAETVLRLFNSIGLAVELSEKDLETAMAIHSCSPAYFYMMIDALADAGVKYGLTKSAALRLAAKAAEGSAKMILETGIHPQQLKDNVCSPGGTTIAAVCELERTGFTSSVQQAVDSCINRNNEMKK